MGTLTDVLSVVGGYFSLNDTRNKYSNGSLSNNEAKNVALQSMLVGAAYAMNFTVPKSASSGLALTTVIGLAGSAFEAQATVLVDDLHAGTSNPNQIGAVLGDLCGLAGDLTTVLSAYLNFAGLKGYALVVNGIGNLFTVGSIAATDPEYFYNVLTIGVPNLVPIVENYVSNASNALKTQIDSGVSAVNQSITSAESIISSALLSIKNSAGDAGSSSLTSDAQAADAQLTSAIESLPNTLASIYSYSATSTTEIGSGSVTDYSFSVNSTSGLPITSGGNVNFGLDNTASISFTDNPDGSSAEFNSKSDGSLEITSYSGANDTGSIETQDLELPNGKSQITRYTNGERPLTTDYSGPEGSGSITNHTTTTSDSVGYFVFPDANGNNGLWVTDGTVKGTKLITNQTADGASLNPANLSVVDGELMFTGSDQGSNGLFILTGNSTTPIEIAGPSVKNHYASVIFDTTAVDSLLYFSAYDYQGKNGLWVSDGTPNGTYEITELNSAPSAITAINNKVIFENIDTQGQNNLWVSDGTPAGTAELAGIKGANSSGVWGTFSGLGMAELDGKVIFSGLNDSGTYGLWITDGTVAGTMEIPVQGAAEGSLGLRADNFVTFNGRVLFRGFGADGTIGLWTTDGTAAGTQELAGINGAYLLGPDPVWMTVYENEVVFEGIDDANQFGLWVTDGTTAGTHELKNIPNLNIKTLGLDPNFTVVNGELMFLEWSSTGGSQLWETDGTSARTHILGSSPTLLGWGADDFASGAVTAVVPLQLPNDQFLGNSATDVLLENTNGSIVLGEVQASGQLAYTQIGGLGPEWHFGGSGDLLGDGKSSFLIENTNGAVDVGEMQNGKIVYAQVSGLGPEWKFVESGNFLGNGQADFLLENTNGTLVVGEVKSGVDTYTQIGGIGQEWKFVGAGDFLGDGLSDYLIESTSGAVVIGEVKNGTAVYIQVGGLGPEWKFAGTGDFTGDGLSDFLIENTNGSVNLGEIQNGKVAYTQVGGLGPEWKFVGAGDYGGTGRDGFLIENSNGAIDVGTIVAGKAQYAQIGGLGKEWTFHG